MIFGNRYAKTRISTPYSKLSEKELLTRFQSDCWNNLNQQGKIDTIQELENRYAVEQKRPVCKIESENNPNNYGSYSRSSNSIRISMEESEQNTSYEMLDSYFHESRHAQQYRAIETGKGLDETTRNICQTELGNNYVGGGKYYDMQTCEMDSNNYAATKMLANKNLFEDDEEFNKYLERRQEHFEKTNKSCHDESDYRLNQQIENTSKSFENGDITEKQVSQIKEHLYNSEDDPVLKESCSIEGRLREENQEKEDAKNSLTKEKAFDEKREQFFEDSCNDATMYKNQDNSNRHQQFFQEKDLEEEQDYDAGKTLKSENEENSKHEQFFKGGGNDASKVETSNNSEPSEESEHNNQSEQSIQVNSIT